MNTSRAEAQPGNNVGVGLYNSLIIWEFLLAKHIYKIIVKL